MISVDTNGLIDAAGKFDPASGAAAVIVISLSFYLISALPITSFRLKRMLLNLTPTDAGGAREQHGGDLPRGPAREASTATSGWRSGRSASRRRARSRST